jgi:tetratricopeptide (TPR) repeat protein
MIKAGNLKNVLMIGISSSVLVFLTLGVSVCFSEDESSNVVVKEVSLQDTVKGLLERNKELQKEKDDLSASVNKLETAQSMYANKIKALTDSLDSLNRQFELKKADAEREKTSLSQEVEALKTDNKALQDKIASIDERLINEDNYKNWQAAQKELDATKQQYVKISIEKEELAMRRAKMHYNMGNIFFEKGDYDKAAYEYEETLKLLPSDADTHYNLAVIYDYHLKNNPKAEWHYRQYLAEVKETESNSSLLNWIKERISGNMIQGKVQTELNS